MLPAQLGNAGKVLNTDGTSAYWAPGVKMLRDARTANTALAVSDFFKLIDLSGTFAQTFNASASLVSGWFCYIYNSGTGLITLTPNGAELIDGLTSRVLSPGETRLIQCDGTTLRTVEASAITAKTINTISAFTASGTFVVPNGIVLIRPYAFGAGAAGTTTASGAGGGCAYGNVAVVPGQSITISIASGVATVTANAIVTHTGNAASGVTAGAASIHASVTSGGAFSGGPGSANGSIPGGSASGSPLGVGGVGSGGGGAWGRSSSGYAGGGIGEAAGLSGGGAYNGGGSRRDPGSYYADPLLAPLTGSGGTGTATTGIYSGDGGPGAGGGSGGSSGGHGGRGGTGAGGGGGQATGVLAGAGGFGGGGGWSSGGTAGAGGLGGGGGGMGTSAPGAGGAACVLVYY